MAFTPSKNKKRQNSACNNGTILAFSENQRQSTSHPRRKAPFLPPKTARTAGRCVCQGARTTPWLSPAFSPQRPKSSDFARFGVSHVCRISSFAEPAVLGSGRIFCSPARRRNVRFWGFRWVRARLCPENRTQPRHAAHAGGQVVSCCACWNASNRFRMRSCSHSASSFASFCS